MLSVKNISFSYGSNNVLKDLNFNVTPGEYLAVIGESGSGKSTLLKVLYGKYDLTQGHIFWKEEKILGPKYNLVIGYDFIKYVSQEFDLMPFTSVEENVGKFLSNFFPNKKQKRVAELLKVVQLTDFAKTKVKTLSGGQKQRVALARAIAKKPEIILLDEPFSHIDNFKKQSLRRNLFSYLKEKNITCIVATHDKDDVLGYADTMVLLNKNTIEISGTPKDLYHNPKTPLIASFFGEYSTINSSIYYAHQLKIVKKSNLKAMVKQAYFNGNNWLIEAEYNGQNIYVIHTEFIKPHSKVSFKLLE